jgi:methionyl-tRNA formyltransferase
MQPEKLAAAPVLEALHALAIDLVVVAAFGQILKPEILNLPAHGCLNIHASLLPRWRGAAPIQAAILNGDAETGISIMRMDPGLDTGGVISQRRIPIAAEDTAGSLAAKLSDVGADLLLQTLPAYLAGGLKAVPQEPSLATYAPMLNKQDGLLDLSMSAAVLENRIRAFNPWPGAYIMWNSASLKVHRAQVASGTVAVGTRFQMGSLPALGTGKDVLVLEEVQPAGKRIMDGRAFLLGARGWSN